MAQVAPSDGLAPVAPTTPPRDALDEPTYELRPPRPLPTLDFSLSLKSRFLSRSALDRATRFVVHREIGVASFLGGLLYVPAVVAPAPTGRIVAVIAALFYFPSVFSEFSMLRLSMVRLLLGTFDFWFTTWINFMTFVMLALMLADARCFVAVSSCLAVQANIMIDANLRAVRLWVVLNVLGVAACLATWSCVASKRIDQATDLLVLGHDSHGLLASAFVSNGLSTITMVLVRNIYRKLHVFRRRLAGKEFIKCVSYRTDLQFVPCTRESLSRAGALAADKPSDACPEYMKTLRCVRTLGLLDARHTLLQISSISSTKAPMWFTTTFQWLGPAAFGVSLCSVFFDVYVLPLVVAAPHASVPMAQVLAMVLTTVYCGACWLHCQRKVLLALWASFDSLFLSLQLFVSFVGACDMLAWGSSSLGAFIVYCWTQWIIFIDAVPPVMRAKLGLDKRFVLAVLLVLVGVSHIPLLLLLFAERSRQLLHDEVVLNDNVLGHQVSVRLLPFLYNCFATASVLLTRLTWRAARSGDSVLLVLDCAVEFENYLRTAQDRRSRRFGSIQRVGLSLLGGSGAAVASSAPVDCFDDGDPGTRHSAPREERSRQASLE